MQQSAKMLNGDGATIIYDPVSSCPRCKKALVPFQLGGVVYKNQDERFAFSVTSYCDGCKSIFLSDYLATEGYASNYLEERFLGSFPVRFAEHDFDISISELSPQFAKFYNQALAAESSGLDEIAGLGYRKALEFLVKDFCIHLHPDSEDEKKKLLLSKCISTYVSNDQIKTLATKAAWIGNDEAHYIRKQENRDVSDMKAFITAMVYFVGMVLITEDAESMSHA